MLSPENTSSSQSNSEHGVRRPMTGYEFELNHNGNRRELRRQKVWAQKQLRSCNENNRYQHTQTTACVVAVNGNIIGPYHPDSLYCYGTNPEVAGLRVTMTVYEDINGTSERDSNGELPLGVAQSSDDSGDECELPVFRNAILVIRHQIIIPMVPRRSASSMHPQSLALKSASIHHESHRDITSKSADKMALDVESRKTPAQNISMQPRLVARHNTNGGGHHQQGRRYLFATTTIPLRGGVAVRPGYRPLEANAAADRIRQWGGSPDKHVFGNAWLIHMAIEPGHVNHVVHSKVMDQVAREAEAITENSRSKARVALGHTMQLPNFVDTTHKVNQQMAQLSKKEGSLSVLLSNHITQKRIARQCPDLVAMWVMAQDNL